MKKIRVINGDITKIEADAIVNAANTTLLGGGGVDGAIHRAAGKELLNACRQLNGCPTGEAKITPGFRLPARYVIHTPGPIWRGGNDNEEVLLASCYRNSLKQAAAAFCSKVCFPSISTGVYRFPLAKAAPIAIRTIAEFLEEDTTIEEVIMVCFDDITLAAYTKALAEWEENHA